MHIAFAHDAVIPPPKYGGTERIVYWLIQALHELGHQTTLIARKGSHVPGTNPILLDDLSNWNQILTSKDLAKVDIVHLWSTPDEAPKMPYLVTIEGNGRPGEIFLPNTVFISKKHAENHTGQPFVYNGIDVNAYPCDERRSDSLVFLAKASWNVKNLEGAISIARRAGLPLEVLGSRDILKFLPRIRGIKYHGMVADPEKKAVLRRAKALLFPVLWHEPFGIAITEALASGCAVLGTPYGSLPEIVNSEVGFLSANSDEIVNALRTKSFDPKKCRERVFQGFSHLDMARAYLEHYQSVASSGFLKGRNSDMPVPKTKEGFVANQLLPWN